MNHLGAFGSNFAISSICFENLGFVVALAAFHRTSFSVCPPKPLVLKLLCRYLTQNLCATSALSHKMLELNFFAYQK